MKYLSPWIQLFLKLKQPLDFLVVQGIKLFYFLKAGWAGFLFFTIQSHN